MPYLFSYTQTSTETFAGILETLNYPEQNCKIGAKLYKHRENTAHSSFKMELGNSDDRVYAAERILKKRVKKVSEKKLKI
jgi:hypothetical protein